MHAKVTEHDLKVCLREKTTHLPFITFLPYKLSPSEGIQLHSHGKYMTNTLGIDKLSVPCFKSVLSFPRFYSSCISSFVWIK